MDYTANHHLPQWEKADRVMMDDFNQMCRDIEAGLNQVQASSDSGISAVNTDLARLHTIVEDVARDTYRRAIVQRVAHNVTSQLDSLWYNGLYSEAEGGDAWTGGYGIRLGTPLATVAGIQATAREISYISTVPAYTYKSKTAAIQFTSDGGGTLQSVTLFTLNYVNEPSEPFSFHIYLRRADTGELVAQAGPFLSEELIGAHAYYARTVNFPLAPGVTYQMDFSVPEGSKNHRVTGFCLVTSQSIFPKQPPLVITSGPTAISLSKHLTPPSWATGATVISHWAGDGALLFSVNGTALTASRTRDAANAVGAACRETEYRLDPLPEGQMELSVSLQQGGGALDLYDYGVLWR